MPDNVTLRVICDEHRALASVLRSLQSHLADTACLSIQPDFQLIRSMLFYVDEFPERQHHKKESELLFPKIRARCLEARDLMDQLDTEHERGEYAIRNLEHEFLAYEVMGESRRASFEAATDRYVDFYLEHMRLEESRVLPLAMQVLTADDWRELDDAFSGNQDPLLSNDAAQPYRTLYAQLDAQRQQCR